jgi:hypothetical protein
MAACSPVKGKVPDGVVVVVEPELPDATVVVVQPEPLPLPLPLPPQLWALAAEAPTTVRQTRNPRHRATLVASRPIVRTYFPQSFRLGSQ